MQLSVYLQLLILDFPYNGSDFIFLNKNKSMNLSRL
jgi:hypothetical protein